MNASSGRADLPKIMFGILFLTILLIASFWIIRPFILGFAWASMVVIATWPVLLKVQKLCWGKRSIAVLVMSLLLLLLFIFPVSLVVSSVVNNSAPLVAWATNSANWHIPSFEWLAHVPVVGKTLHNTWDTMIADGGSTLFSTIQPYAGKASTWFVSKAANLGFFILHCALMLAFSIILYSRGEQVAEGIRHFAFRLAQERGEASVILAAQAIRAVALGVVVTALVQSVLGGIGLAISGIPYSTLLTMLMFIFCVAQLGPLPVLLPAVAWLYWSGDATWGTVLLVWSAVVGMMDGVLRPMLIKMGADLPLLLILSGVIGGLLAFGMIGLFIGPVVLAVSYRLLSAWVSEVPHSST